MTSKIFHVCLQKLNDKFRIQGRNILLFLDNCSSHLDLTLSNIKLQFLPPNTTSRLQPCDAGIIQSTKLHYRKIFLRRMICKMEQDKTSTSAQLAKSVTLLDAITWIRVSWLRVQPETITKCFKKCGFTPSSNNDEIESNEVESNSYSEDFKSILDGITLQHFVSCDDDVEVHCSLEQCPDGNSDNIATISDDDEGDDKVIDLKTALNYHDELMKFALSQNNNGMVESLVSFASEMFNVKVSQAKQTKISDFFCRN